MATGLYTYSILLGSNAIPLLRKVQRPLLMQRHYADVTALSRDNITVDDIRRGMTLLRATTTSKAGAWRCRLHGNCFRFRSFFP